MKETKAEKATMALYGAYVQRYGATRATDMLLARMCVAVETLVELIGSPVGTITLPSEGKRSGRAQKYDEKTGDAQVVVDAVKHELDNAGSIPVATGGYTPRATDL